MSETITFWDDLPNSKTVEGCYVSGCFENTSGGGTQDGVAVTLCALHRTPEGYAEGAARLASWKT